MPSLEDLSEQQRNDLATLAQELADSPDTRKDFLALTRKKRPNMPMPELDIEERLAKNEQDSAAKIAALESKLSEKEMREELARRRQSLIDSGKANSQEDVEAIEKLMLEKGIQSHETAADYFAWMQQASRPTPVNYNRNVIDTDTRKGLAPYWKNPITAARDEAAKAFSDFRKNPKIAG